MKRKRPSDFSHSRIVDDGYWLLVNSINIYFLPILCIIQRGYHRCTDNWLMYLQIASLQSAQVIEPISRSCLLFSIKIWNICGDCEFTYYYYHWYSFAFNFYFMWNVHSRLFQKGQESIGVNDGTAQCILLILYDFGCNCQNAKCTIIIVQNTFPWICI